MSILLVCIVVAIVLLRYRRWTKPTLSKLPGPPPESFILGNMRELYQGQVGEADFKWMSLYGGLMRIKGILGENILFVTDPKAVHHIYHSGRYHRHVIRREMTRTFAGRGLLQADSDEHRRQRRVIAPAFGAAEIKALGPVFADYAARLTGAWKEIIGTGTEPSVVLDMPSWISRATLDVMGEAAFDYQFHAMGKSDNPLRRAFANVPTAFGGLSAKTIFVQQALQFLPPRVFAFLLDRYSLFEPAREAARLAIDVSRTLVQEKAKAAAQGEVGRDVMSLLVKANLNEKPGEGLKEEEMLSSMQTIMFAGHETTANSISWTLFELCRHPEIQTRLRSEIWAAEDAKGGVELSANELEALPYLQAVMKELFRFNPIAYSGYREATTDDILPLSNPVTLNDGRVVTEVPIPKGTSVYISIVGYNRNEAIFGEDSHMFKPERWLNGDVPLKTSNPSVGVYNNLLTFGSGARACIGWRFALLEYQTFIVQMVRDFEFSMDEGTMANIRRDAAFVMLATIEGEVDKGAQLPLRVSLAKRE